MGSVRSIVASPFLITSGKTLLDDNTSHHLIYPVFAVYLVPIKF